METELNTETALIYAYKTKDPERWGISPDEINLAYQVDNPFSRYQCDFGKDLTAFMLREFKKAGNNIRLIYTDNELILPLPEHKVLVPVPLRLLEEWELSDLLR